MTKVLKPKKEAEKEVTSLFEDEYTFTLLAGYTDKDGVVHKEFSLREITGKDEEVISKPELRSNPSKLISTLISRCLVRLGTYTYKNSGGSSGWMEIIKSLYTADQDFIMMKLREISVGTEIVTHHECKSCKTKLVTTLETDEIEIIPFNGIHNIPFELPKGYKDKKGEYHREGKIRVANGLDRELLGTIVRTNIAKANTLLLTRLCSFDDGTYIDEDIISSLTKRDREHLQKKLEDNKFGYMFSTEVTCDKCGSSFTGLLNVTNFI